MSQGDLAKSEAVGQPNPDVRRRVLVTFGRSFAGRQLGCLSEAPPVGVIGLLPRAAFLQRGDITQRDRRHVGT
jgi:hypothetical protein